MIKIDIRETSDPGTCVYEIKINDKFITSFKHKREEGLSVCLLRAAEAVEKKDLLDFYFGIKDLL
jgi:hypothetical protein